MATPKQVKIGYCQSCEREYATSSLYSSKAEFTSKAKTIPYCKKCCEEILKYYIAKTGTLESAMYFTCAKLDVPFIKKVYDSMVAYKKSFQDKTKKADTEYDIFSYYYRYLWGSSSMQGALDEWNCFADSDTDLSQIQNVSKDVECLKLEAKELKLKWGCMEDVEDYEYLEYQFDKYTNGIKFDNPQQEDLYRDLCLARLEKRKIEEKRSDGDLTKVQTRILTLLNKLKLDNFEDTKPKSISDQLIFAKIKMIEQTKPCDLYKEPKKYRDFNKLRKYEKDMVLRPLLNTLVGHKDFDISMDDIAQYDLKDDWE